jgi:hypothetical protein
MIPGPKNMTNVECTRKETPCRMYSLSYDSPMFTDVSGGQDLIKRIT